MRQRDDLWCYACQTLTRALLEIMEMIPNGMLPLPLRDDLFTEDHSPEIDRAASSAELSTSWLTDNVIVPNINGNSLNTLNYLLGVRHWALEYLTYLKSVCRFCVAILA